MRMWKPKETDILVAIAASAVPGAEFPASLGLNVTLSSASLDY